MEFPLAESAQDGLDPKKKVPRAFLASLWSKFRASGKEGVSRADEEVWKDCAWYLM